MTCIISTRIDLLLTSPISTWRWGLRHPQPRPVSLPPCLDPRLGIAVWSHPSDVAKCAPIFCSRFWANRPGPSRRRRHRRSSSRPFSPLTYFIILVLDAPIPPSRPTRNRKLERLHKTASRPCSGRHSQPKIFIAPRPTHLRSRVPISTTRQGDPYPGIPG